MKTPTEYYYVCRPDQPALPLSPEFERLEQAQEWQREQGDPTLKIARAGFC
ncbi:hypothetical protein [Marinobacter nauticus]|jgi:hypothetical protein|uniref:hypothetical protein n=1 Tax=Marinobacter nauticus TaxID=2743 RepID=UPI0012FCC420|nr:hypothetical protein [Marinobacter nauticus]